MIDFEPIWLSKVVLLDLQAIQINTHGGLHGIRAEDLLDSALNRPVNVYAYGDHAQIDLMSLAAAYAYGLAKNHPFLDGNKRIGFIAAVVFLETNGIPVWVAEDAAIEAMLQLAGGEMSEDAFAQWLRDNLGPPYNPN
jgi:death-on-curing protein